MKERLKYIQDALLQEVEKHIDNLPYVNAEEMGEVIDMIKDIEEAIYYCTITKSMEGKCNWSTEEENSEEPMIKKGLMEK